MLLHMYLYLLLLVLSTTRIIITSSSPSSPSSSSSSTTAAAVLTRTKTWRSSFGDKSLNEFDAQLVHQNNKHNFYFDFHAKRINTIVRPKNRTYKVTTVPTSAIILNTYRYAQQQQQQLPVQHQFKIGVFKKFSTFTIGTFTSSPRHTKLIRPLLMIGTVFNHIGRSKIFVSGSVQARKIGFVQVLTHFSLDSNSYYNYKRYKTTQNQVSMSTSIDNNNISNDDTTTNEAALASTSTTATKPIVQYIFVRTDLKSSTNDNDKEETTVVSWSNGAIAAQVAHASVAAIMNGLYYNDPYTKQYVNITTNQLQNMTKLVFAVSNEQELLSIQKVWYEQQQYTIPIPTTTTTTTPTTASDNNDTTTTGTSSCNSSIGKGYLWQEQPENIPTAFATWPVERTNAISKIIKKLKVSFY